MYKHRNLIILTIFFLIFLITLTFWYIRLEIPIFQCDYLNNHLRYIEYSQILQTDVKALLIKIIGDLQSSPLSGVLNFPFYLLSLLYYSKSRFYYILQIELLYMVPLIFLTIYFIYKKIIPYNKTFSLLNATIITSIMFLPALYFLSLRGMPYIGSIILLFIILLKFMNQNFEEKIDIKNSVILGSLCYLTSLTARCFLSFFVPIIISLFVFSVYRIIENKKYKKQTTNLMINMFVVLISYVIWLLIWQFQFFIDSVKLSFEVYQSYADFNIVKFFNAFVRQIGLITMFLFIFSIVISIFVKTKQRQNVLFLVFTIFTNLFLISTYSFVDHYTTPTIICIAIVNLYALSVLIDVLRKRAGTKIFIVPILLLYITYIVINFVNYINPNLNDKIINNKYLANSHGWVSTPSVFENLNEFKEIYETLWKLVSADNVNSKISVYTCMDEVVSYWELYGYSIYADGELYKHFLPTREYFNYEGYNIKELNSDYILFTEPVRGIMEEREDFLPMYLIVEAFKNKTSISKSYTCVFYKDYKSELFTNWQSDKEYSIKVYIYKRVKNVSVNEVKELFENILLEVPEYRDIYEKQLEEYRHYIENI